jgi:hypothetical protein
MSAVLQLATSLKPWLKVLFTDLLWEKNTICWLKKYEDKNRAEM